MTCRRRAVEARRQRRTAANWNWPIQEGCVPSVGRQMTCMCMSSAVRDKQLGSVYGRARVTWEDASRLGARGGGGGRRGDEDLHPNHSAGNSSLDRQAQGTWSICRWMFSEPGSSPRNSKSHGETRPGQARLSLLRCPSGQFVSDRASSSDLLSGFVRFLLLDWGVAFILEPLWNS